MSRGIPSAVCPGSTLSDSLGSAWEELNTCTGICWGLANCAGNSWCSHKLNMVSQGLHFYTQPKALLLQPGWELQQQPWILPCFCSLMPTNLCVPLSSLPLLPVRLLQPLRKMSGLQGVTGTLRQTHSLHVRNPGNQNLVFNMPVFLFFSLTSSSYSRHLTSLADENKQKIIKATQRPVQSTLQEKVWVIQFCC